MSETAEIEEAFNALSAHVMDVAWQAATDTALYGQGYVRFNVDGSIEYLAPEAWPTEVWAADLEQEQICQAIKDQAAQMSEAFASFPMFGNLVMTYAYMPQEVNHLQAAADAVTQAAIAAGQELIECADGKKRSPAEKQAWETHIWDQLRQVQG